MKKTYVISTLAVLAVLFAVLTSFTGIRMAEQNMPHIELPDEQEDGGAGSGLELLLEGSAPQSVEITEDNVLGIIEALARPSEYSAEVSVYLSWSGGSDISQRSIWVKDGVTRVEHTQGGQTQVSLVYDDYTYIWNHGATNCYRGATSGFSADSAAGIPTYEDIGAMGDADITGCGATVSSGRSCLWVQTTDGSFVYDWYIDLENGLLVRMDQSLGGVLKCRTDISAVSELELEDAYFELPEGMRITGFV